MRSYFLYILRCSDNSLYIGHTNDLDRRFGEHGEGSGSVHTAEKVAVEVVWGEEFQTREEAYLRERQIKGWTRRKKEALVAGDWDRMKFLAKSFATHGTTSARLAALIEKDGL
jgi:predicted GIY-YIG superfamily endonuclease